MQKQFLIASASAVALLAAMPGAHAASSDASQIAILKRQIQAQQNQLQQQQQLLDNLIANQQQTKSDVAKISAAAKPAAKPSAIAVMSASHKPGWRSADGQNEIDLGALLQVDGGINSYRPGNPAAQLKKLTSGINARRAQIQVSGTFAEDFHFALQYDLGGSNEAFTSSTTGNAGGVGAGFKTALFTYTGFKPFGTNLSLEFGYTSPPITIDSAIPSEAGLFMEHPAPDRLSTNVSGGPGRGELGFRDYTNRWFGYFALSGPKSGDVHDSSVGSQPLTAIGRGAFNIVNNDNLKLQLGGTFQRYIQMSTKGYSLADEAEDRVDTTTFIGLAFTGTGNNRTTGGGTEAVEAAAEWGPLFATGSYIMYDVERLGLKQNNFYGYYADVMYSITGEKHPYLASSGGWGNLNPAHPVSLKTGGLGAWEVGVRYSYANFNDQLGAAGNQAVNGGHFNDLTLGLNWYITNNLRFQLNWLHGFTGGILANPHAGTVQTGVTQQGGALTAAAGSPVQGNARWDEIGIRTQFSF